MSAQIRRLQPRRRFSLSSTLGISDHFFTTGAQRRFADNIEAGLQRVEARLSEEVRFADAFADTTGRYLLQAGGKRVRPVLVLLTAQLGEGATDEVVRVATALEITHLASLYHDDVMDDAPVRRGVPSAQTVWGNSVAVITGDLLFARASIIMVGLGQEALRLQANTFERLCLGQLHETIGPEPDEDPVAHYLQVLADKTGSLIAAAAESGVRFSGAPTEYIAPVRTFGEKVGIAFQLIDDVIDLSARSEATGKAAGTDLRGGVATLPMLLLRKLAREDREAAELIARIDSAVTNQHEAELDSVVELLREHPVTAQTRLEARRAAEEAVSALDVLPDGHVKAALSEFAAHVVDRDG